MAARQRQRGVAMSSVHKASEGRARRAPMALMGVWAFFLLFAAPLWLAGAGAASAEHQQCGAPGARTCPSQPSAGSGPVDHPQAPGTARSSSLSEGGQDEDATVREWAELARGIAQGSAAGAGHPGGATGRGVGGSEEPPPGAGEDYSGERALADSLILWLAGQGADGVGAFNPAVTLEVIPGTRTASAAADVFLQESPEELKKLRKWDNRADMRLVATRAARKGEQLVTIPWGVVAQSSGVPGLWEQERAPGTNSPPLGPLVSALQPHSLLALWLLGEQAKAGDSPWAPFIAALPAYVPLPVFFTDDVLQEIQYHPILQRVDMIRRHMVEEFTKAADGVPAAGLPTLGHLSRERFQWALAVVFSRALPLPPGGSQGGEGGPALVPLLDFMHHDFGTTTCVIRATEAGVVLEASRDISPGEALTADFGPQTEDDAFLLHGAVPPSLGPADGIQLLSSREQLLNKFLRLGGYLPGVPPAPELGEVAQGEWARAGKPEAELRRKGESILRAVEAAVVQAKQEALAFFGLPQGTPGMPEGGVQRYAIWAQGSHVDPEVVAGLGALCAYGLRMKRPRDAYALLARASVALAWLRGPPGADCDGIREAIGDPVAYRRRARAEGAPDLALYLLGKGAVTGVGQRAGVQGEVEGEEEEGSSREGGGVEGGAEAEGGEGGGGEGLVAPGLKATREVMQALRYGVLAVQNVLGASLQRFQTSVDDDTMALRILDGQCADVLGSSQVYRERAKLVAPFCNPAVLSVLPEVLATTRYRLRKKKVLQLGVHRLAAQCAAGSGGDGEGAAARSVTRGEAEERAATEGKSEVQLVQEMVDWMYREGKGTKEGVFVATAEEDPAVEVRVVAYPSKPKDCCHGHEGETEDGEGEAEEGSEDGESSTPAPRAHLGVFAVRDIAAGEPILALPRVLWASSSPVASDRLPFPGVQSSYSLLAAFLLRERARGNASHWAPYLRVLPPHLPLHPLYFAEDITRELQHQPLIQKLVAHRRFIQLDYRRSLPQGNGHASEEQHLWAHVAVMSRAFTSPRPFPSRRDERDHGWEGGQGDGAATGMNDALFQGKNLALLPFADLLDHSASDPNVHFDFDPEAKLYSMTATRNIAKGEPLYDSYGQRSSDFLFRVYGFFVENNPYDVVPLFEDVAELIEWWYAKYAAAPLAQGHDDSAPADVADGSLWRFVSVARKAEEAALHAFESHPDQARLWFLRSFWSDSNDPTQSAWAGHRLQHTLVAVLASLFQAQSAPGEPNYEALAEAAFFLGWFPEGDVCGVIEERLETAEEQGAVGRAGEAIRARALESLAAYPTTIEQDEEIAGALERCAQGRAWGGAPGLPSDISEFCGKYNGLRRSQFESAVKLRLLIKNLYKELQGCCRWAC